MSMRMAGKALGIGAAGLGGAIAADALAHEPIDRLAQELKGKVYGPYEQGNEQFQMLYANLLGSPKTLLEQAAVVQTLGGGIASLDRVLDPDQVAEVKGSERGMKLVQLAQKVHEDNPGAALAMASIGSDELELIFKERELGLTPKDVVEAVEQGAGVSPLPAALGGLGAGGGVAALAALTGRRRGP